MKFLKGLPLSRISLPFGPTHFPTGMDSKEDGGWAGLEKNLGVLTFQYIAILRSHTFMVVHRRNNSLILSAFKIP